MNIEDFKLGDIVIDLVIPRIGEGEVIKKWDGVSIEVQYDSRKTMFSSGKLGYAEMNYEDLKLIKTKKIINWKERIKK